MERLLLGSNTTKVFIMLIIISCLLFGIFRISKSECVVPSLTTVSGTHAPQGKICPGDLIFEDNFDELDLRKWQHEQMLGGGGNGEFQWYTNNRSNSYTMNGTLFIKPTLLADGNGEDYLSYGTIEISGGSPAEECTNPQNDGCRRTGTPTKILNPVKSAKMRTLNSLSFKYGTVEVRAKIPAGDWLWPAIWMMPRYNQYSTWPVSGEIDILESRGNRDLIASWGPNIGTQQVGSTLHWGPSYRINKFMMTNYEKHNSTGFDKDFHKYRLEWSPDRISFLVDGEETGAVAPPEGGFWELGNLTSTGYKNPWARNSKMAPFDQEFYLILNLAIGSTSYFPDDATNPGGKPWKNTSPNPATDFWKGRNQWLPTWQLKTDNAAFQIDYVRIWAH